MNTDKSAIFSECVYDVDNRHVDLSLHRVGSAFMLSLTDTSNDGECDNVIELYLSKENLRLVIDRLTKVLENG
jgi:hypothetical protein